MAAPVATRARPPRGFRRRLFVALAIAALLPVGAWGLFSEAIVDRLLQLSFAPLDSLLGELEAQPALSAELRTEVEQARLSLVQAELARRALGKLAPRVFLALTLASALALLGAAVFVGRRLTRPVEALTEGISRYAAGDLAHRVEEPPANRQDELAFLVRQFNQMGSELERQRAQLRAAEQLSAWQDVARTMAHELRNPLTAMRMAIARLEKARAGQAAPGAADEALSLLTDEIALLTRLTQSFSGYAQLPPPRPEVVELRPLARDVCALYGDGGARVRLLDGPELRASVDPDQLRRALGNLVKNALEAGGPDVEVELLREGDAATLAIRDRGEGLAAPIEGTRLLRGLLSTKPGGSGLGLPVAAKFAVDHGGALELVPREGGGAEARLRIPALTA